MRKCSACGHTKELDKFYNDKNLPLGRSYLCKSCSKVKKRNNEIRKAYGITQLEYEGLLKSQNYRCAICSSDDPGTRVNRFSIDHCHKIGKVRGLLCNSCNNGLGRFKDNVGILARAIGYLEAN